MTVEKIMITGDRRHQNGWMIWAVLTGLWNAYPKATLIVGDAKGADSTAWAWAKMARVRRRRFVARWDEEGRAAGPKRNLRMLDQKPDLVVAFHDDLERSKGTRHAVEQAKKRGAEVWLVSKL